MIPGKYNDWVIYQDSIWDKTINYPSRDLTGGTFAMEIVKPDGTSVITLTTANGRISAALSGSNTEITLRIDADDTAALDFTVADYDLEYTPSTGAADKERLFYGKIAFNREVTTI